MTDTPPNLSIRVVQKLLNQKQDQIQQLFQRRDELQRLIDHLDDQIRDAAFFDARPMIGRRQMQNRVSLPKLITQILTKQRRGLTLGELAEQIKATGYKSHSRNFNNVVYQTLYQMQTIEHDKRTRRYTRKK